MQSDLFSRPTPPKPDDTAKPNAAKLDTAKAHAPQAPTDTPTTPPLNLALLHGRALEDGAREMVRGLGVTLRASVDEVPQETRGAWEGRGWLLTAQTPTVIGGVSWWTALRLVWWSREGVGQDESAWEVRAALVKAKPNNKDLATHHALSLRLGLDTTMQTLDAHAAYQCAARHLASRGTAAPDGCIKELATAATRAASEIARAYGR